MKRLYAAELLKLRTLRGPWGFLIVAIGLAALFTAGNIGGATEAARLEERYQYRLILDMAFPTGILSLLLGIILFTNEFRHGTIARTLLAVPRRWRLVVTKLVTGATSGTVLELMALGTSLLVAVVWLSALDIPLEGPSGRRSAAPCTRRSGRSSVLSFGCSSSSPFARSSSAWFPGTGSPSTCRPLPSAASSTPRTGAFRSLARSG